MEQITRTELASLDYSHPNFRTDGGYLFAYDMPIGETWYTPDFSFVIERGNTIYLKFNAIMNRQKRAVNWWEVWRDEKGLYHTYPRYGGHFIIELLFKWRAQGLNRMTDYADNFLDFLGHLSPKL